MFAQRFLTPFLVVFGCTFQCSLRSARNQSSFRHFGGIYTNSNSICLSSGVAVELIGRASVVVSRVE